MGYAYDPASNRTADTRNRTAHQYAYDLLDQLTQVQRQEHCSRSKLEEAYTYDPLGNRLTGPQKDTYTYDATNRLTQDSTHTYAYDANGNLVETRSLEDGRLTTYTYDAEDRLVRVVTPKAEVIFQYDPLGRRIEKRVVRWEDEDGDYEPDEEEKGTPRLVRYLYDQEDILATFADTGKELARYTHGPGVDEPLAEARKHRTRFYHADVLGSIVTLTDKHGHPIRHYRYSAFGVPEDHRGDLQPYRFTGREWDKEVGLYYYRARYYDARQSRFLSEDPMRFLPTGSNAYAYVGNSPLSFTDPYGLWDQRTTQIIKATSATLTVAAGLAVLTSTAPVTTPALALAAGLTVYGEFSYLKALRDLWRVESGKSCPAASQGVGEEVLGTFFGELGGSVGWGIDWTAFLLTAGSSYSSVAKAAGTAAATSKLPVPLAQEAGYGALSTLGALLAP